MCQAGWACDRQTGRPLLALNSQAAPLQTASPQPSKPPQSPHVNLVVRHTRVPSSPNPSPYSSEPRRAEKKHTEVFQLGDVEVGV